MNLILAFLLMLDGKLGIVLGRRYPIRLWAALLPEPAKEELLDCFARTPDAVIRLMGVIEFAGGLFILLRRRRDRSAAPAKTD